MDSRRDDEEKAATAVDMPLPAASPIKTRRHAGDVHLLSAAFFFLFSAYLPTQNLQSTLNTVHIHTLPAYVAIEPQRIFPSLTYVLDGTYTYVHAGRRHGRRVDGDPVRLPHALRDGGVTGGEVAGRQARARRWHQRLRALYPRQPPSNMVRSGTHSDSGMVWAVWFGRSWCLQDGMPI